MPRQNLGGVRDGATAKGPAEGAAGAMAGDTVRNGLNVSATPDDFASEAPRHAVAMSYYDPRPCIICGAIFLPHWHFRSICGDPCRTISRKRAMQAYWDRRKAMITG